MSKFLDLNPFNCFFFETVEGKIIRELVPPGTIRGVVGDMSVQTGNSLATTPSISTFSSVLSGYGSGEKPTPLVNDNDLTENNSAWIDPKEIKKQKRLEQKAKKKELNLFTGLNGKTVYWTNCLLTHCSH